MLQKVQVWTSKSTLTYLEVWGHFQLSGWCVTSPFLMAVNLWKRVLNQSSLIILSGNRFQICIKTLISVTAFDYQYKGYFRKKYEREKWYNSFHTLSILKKRSSYKHKKNYKPCPCIWHRMQYFPGLIHTGQSTLDIHILQAFHRWYIGEVLL